MRRGRLLIVDDHEIVRRGLAALLAMDPEFDVVDEAGSAAEVEAAVEREFPDVILMDLKVGEEDGVEIAERLLKRRPDANIMILTAFIDEEAIYRSLICGVKGYVLKDVDAQNLIRQIKTVKGGEPVLDPRVLEIVVRKLRDLSKYEADRRMGLTAQEVEIVRLVAEGLTNKQIAQRVILSENTIKSHLQSIMNKMAVSNRAELVSRAMKMSII
jgi:two-component system NarL family response regulator/two-component system response regulator DevR